MCPVTITDTTPVNEITVKDLKNIIKKIIEQEYEKRLLTKDDLISLTDNEFYNSPEFLDLTTNSINEHKSGQTMNF